MKKLIYTFLFIVFAIPAFGQVAIEATVGCPSCRPIPGCGICWETKEQADNCINDRNADTIPIDFRVSPNPTKSGTFRITHNQEISGTILIINQLGSIVKTIESENSKTNQLSIDGSDLSEGLYFIKYLDLKTKESITKKLLLIE